MAGASKRVNCVKVCFTDREYIDLNRAGVREGRTKADMAYWLVRQGLYGILKPPDAEEEGTNGSDDAPR